MLAVNWLPAYILAGGRSQRFGTDKARAEIAGEPMLLAIARQVDPHVSSVTAIADRAGRYDDLGVRTIADLTPHLGPLGGLLTALRDAQTQDASHLLLLACDQPRVGQSWILQLRASDDPPDIVAFHAPAPATAYPTPALYATRLDDEVGDLLVGAPPPGPQRLITRCVTEGHCRLLSPPEELLDVNVPAQMPESP